MRARSAASASDLRRSSASSRPETLLRRTKEDKRRIKHAQLMSKVTKSTPTKVRRRRPHKKLATTLDALADALPSDDEQDKVTRDAAGTKLEQQVNIISRKSLKSRPGAMKRRERIDKNERDRFAKNLAQMANTQPASEDQIASKPAEKWRALRGFIAQTLETRPDLAGGKG